MLLASGYIAYLGVFQAKTRQKARGQWELRLQNYQLPFTKEFSLRAVLGSESQIRQWHLDKLPRAMEEAVENAVLLSHSRRWCLFLDPQRQGHRERSRSHLLFK